MSKRPSSAPIVSDARRQRGNERCDIRPLISSIGTGRVARSAPDGYTVGIGHNQTHVINGATQNLSYDVTKDFEPVTLLADTPIWIITRKNLPALGAGAAAKGRSFEDVRRLGAPEGVVGVLFGLLALLLPAGGLSHLLGRPVLPEGQIAGQVLFDAAEGLHVEVGLSGFGQGIVDERRHLVGRLHGSP